MDNLVSLVPLLTKVFWGAAVFFLIGSIVQFKLLVRDVSRLRRTALGHLSPKVFGS
jgi:hypothetical protein